MRLEVINGAQSLEQLREDWEAVYESDPEANFFLSWPWMSDRLRGTTTPWIVLAVRPAGDSARRIAFFPLSLGPVMTPGGVRRELRTAGSPVADYSGFLCRPEHEREVTAIFGEGLQKLVERMPWDQLNLVGFRTSEARLQAFLSHFARAGCRFASRQTDNGDGIDYAVCPHIELPGDWDAYLAGAVSANTRQKIRRFLRRIDGSPELSIVQPTAETIGRSIDTLLTFWEAKWAARKEGGMTRIRPQTTAMLTRAFENGTLFLPTLLSDGRPIGALAILVDRVKRSYLFYIGARDDSFTGLPPGFCLHAYSIRHAIAHGFRTYDFLRGDEPYKFLFGAQPRRITGVIVHRPAEAQPAAVPSARPAHEGGVAADGPPPPTGEAVPQLGAA